MAERYQADVAGDERAAHPAAAPLYPGFDRPTSHDCRLPNVWTHSTVGMVTWAEHKAVEYVLRHTWGYRDDGLRRRSTLDEFLYGRKRHAGSRLRRGNDKGQKVIIDGSRATVRQGYLDKEGEGTDPARIRMYDALSIQPGAEVDGDDSSNGWDSEIEHPTFGDRAPGVRSTNSRSSVYAQRSEKDTVERHFEQKKGAVVPPHARTMRGAQPRGFARYSRRTRGVCTACSCYPHDPDCLVLAAEVRENPTQNHATLVHERNRS